MGRGAASPSRGCSRTGVRAAGRRRSSPRGLVRGRRSSPVSNSALPQVWSPWWWVLTRVRTGALVTDAMAAVKARVRRSVAQESTAIDALRADGEAGVVDPPGAVGLDVGPDAVRDLCQAGSPGCGDVVHVGAHGWACVAVESVAVRSGRSGAPWMIAASMAPSPSTSSRTRSPGTR